MDIPIKKGLHNQLFPDGLGRTEIAPYRVLHYGYSTQQFIEDRWRERSRLGVPVNIRRRCINESEMVLQEIPRSWFPRNIRLPESELRPEPIRYSEDIMEEAGL